MLLQQAGGEAELAMEMWWRAAALDALQACCPVALHLPMLSSNLVCSTSKNADSPAGTAQLRQPRGRSGLENDQMERQTARVCCCRPTSAARWHRQRGRSAPGCTAPLRCCWPPRSKRSPPTPRCRRVLCCVRHAAVPAVLQLQHLAFWKATPGQGGSRAQGLVSPHVGSSPPRLPAPG